MAPALEEPKKEREARIRKGPYPVLFGRYHPTWAVVHEDGVYRVRRLEVPPGVAEAYLKEHGIFMPEHSAMLSKPIGRIERQASTLDDLLTTPLPD